VNHARLSKLPVAVCLAAAVILGDATRRLPRPRHPPAASTRACTRANRPYSSHSVGDRPGSIRNAVVVDNQRYLGLGRRHRHSRHHRLAIRLANEVGHFHSHGQRPGGSVEATTRVTVNPPPPPPPPATPSMTDEQLFEQNVHDVYFDYDKANLRAQDLAVAEQDAAFLFIIRT